MDCFKVWNDSSNERPRTVIMAAGYTVAAVSTTRDACGYIFHDQHGALSLNSRRKGSSVTWDDPMIGEWSPQQQKLTHDNATVGPGGRLDRR
jgi:hypothetical protein